MTGPVVQQCMCAACSSCVLALSVLKAIKNSYVMRLKPTDHSYLQALALTREALEGRIIQVPKTAGGLLHRQLLPTSMFARCMRQQTIRQ